MPKRVSADKWLYIVTLLLVFSGLVMVFSASAVMALRDTKSAAPEARAAQSQTTRPADEGRGKSPAYFLTRQLICAVAGIGAMFLLMRFDYRKLRTPAVVFPVLGITTVLLLSTFLLARSRNTHRWLKAGPISFQPSELAKLALILFLAWYIDSKIKDIEDWRTLIRPALVIGLLAGLIVAQHDLGTALACVAIGATMLFVAGMRLHYYVYALVAAPIPFYLLVWRVAWRRARIEAFLNPFKDPMGSGYQVIQSMIAVGTGGITGVGLMESKQKLFWLPDAHTDFIFAITAEELGLWGSLIIVGLFAVFCYRGIRAAVLCKDPFGRHLAAGITAMVILQALFNMSVVLGLVPNKGIPLPFISYGGSSLFMTLASVGVLLNITQQTD